MLNSIKDFFDNYLTKNDVSAEKQAGNYSLELAATILLLEISLADSSIDEVELEVIEDAVRNTFHLPVDEVQSLISLAKKEVDHAVSLHDFTSLINQKLTMEEKVKIVELLWRVAFADAVMDKYEEYYVRKIADLLYVSHKDFIRTKHLASINN